MITTILSHSMKILYGINILMLIAIAVLLSTHGYEYWLKKPHYDPVAHLFKPEKVVEEDLQGIAAKVRDYLKKREES